MGPSLRTLDEALREAVLVYEGVLVSFKELGPVGLTAIALSIEASQSVWRSAIDRILPATP